MQIETTNLIIVVGFSLVVTLLAYLLVMSRKKSGYDKTQKEAILGEARSSLESQIYSLNKRLIQSEERWKDVNHLLLTKGYLENDSPILTSKKTFYSEFLKANGISENDLTIDNRLVFVLTPFHSEYAADYLAIRDVCTSMGFNCKRGDESYFKSDIFPQMLKLIIKANLIIANLNGRNPNVLYELGIAQALDKAVILVSQHFEDLPVDIKSKRFLIYSTRPELQQMLRTMLFDLPK
jgi:hypothetical protein